MHFFAKRPERVYSKLYPEDDTARYIRQGQDFGEALNIARDVIGFLILDVLLALAIAVVTVWVGCKAGRKVWVSHLAKH